ncbi:NUDIX domain-containing protein [Paenibacillus pasadenensis]|uniref:NUDIX hydrolase n=1 Tax=Paenibacillus pasadenensis TaxID=217090 RepID=UPI00203AB2D6|nr:NUDIX domain-containing protein [Paenibacillus pasadenensis]MCM3748099.1 NUDIX domain-containing protein [Paenibacillus pasadenensis]
MGYIEELREIVGSQPLILVRPSVVIVNNNRQILLVKYQDGAWGIPGGLMELGESVEDCIRREAKEEININLGPLQLLGVYSGKELYAKLKNGHEYYNVVVGYLCTEYTGELKADGDEVVEAKFYSLTELPESTQPFIKEKMKEMGPRLEQILRGAR